VLGIYTRALTDRLAPRRLEVCFRVRVVVCTLHTWLSNLFNAAHMYRNPGNHVHCPIPGVRGSGGAIVHALRSQDDDECR
jgi:hypothetical protein